MFIFEVINKTFEPRWAEQFDFHLDDNNHVLDLMIQSKNTVLGKYVEATVARICTRKRTVLKVYNRSGQF